VEVAEIPTFSGSILINFTTSGASSPEIHFIMFGSVQDAKW
jgi:hypothetical protein